MTTPSPSHLSPHFPHLTLLRCLIRRIPWASGLRGGRSETCSFLTALWTNPQCKPLHVSILLTEHLAQWTWSGSVWFFLINLFILIGEYFTEWSKSERQILCMNTYKWHLERWYQQSCVQGGKGDTDVKNRLLDSGRRWWWNDLREQHWNIYITTCDIDNQCEFNAWSGTPKAGNVVMRGY